MKKVKSRDMKLLLIMPRFFDYPQTISDELNRMGYEVDFFDDRPSTNPWMKAAIRINKNLVNNFIRAYFNDIMKTISTKRYDVVFLISGQSLSFDESMIRRIKNCQQQAKFLLYQWDSLKNFPYIERMEKYFDKCFTFDREDAERVQRLNFLPLFYSRRYEEIGKKNKKNYKYDFCFVGTAHPQKYEFIKKMSSQLTLVYPNQFVYFFYPSRIVYFYRKFKNPELKNAKISEFHFTPLKGSEMDEIYSNSMAVMDSPQAGQIGLTIRVFEALGAKKKLITTNRDIENYDFYREENIYVYDGKSIDLNSCFFTLPYVKIPQEIYEKYSLENWLRTILF